jgi:hypothetical protein
MLRNQDTVTSRQVGTKSEIEGCCITEVPTLEKSVILRRLLSSRMILATGYANFANFRPSRLFLVHGDNHNQQVSLDGKK